MDARLLKSDNGYYIEVTKNKRHLYVVKIFKNKMFMSSDYAHAKKWQDIKIAKGHCKDIREGRTTQ